MEKKLKKDRDIRKQRWCTGCSACANSCPKKCIQMKKDRYGFYYPRVQSSECVKCGICKKICPVSTEIKKCKDLPIGYAVISKNDKLRENSSSGGAFSELAKIIIEQNGIVYGAAYNEKFEVCHVGINNEKDLWRLQGAKYSESYLGTTFKKILADLKNEKYVLFSGTPCQVAGLKSFLKKDFEKLICVDFICHGIPSSDSWDKYIKFRLKVDKENELPVSINMRSKDTGWSKYQYSMLIRYKDEKECTIKNSDNLFMKLFVGDYINRKSCSNCQFKGYKHISDITLGDFWGIWDIVPLMDDNKGTSVVLVQSSKGKNIWNRIVNKVTYTKVTLEEISRQNRSILVPSKANKDRKKALRLIEIEQFEKCQDLIENRNSNWMVRLKNMIKKW